MLNNNSSGNYNGAMLSTTSLIWVSATGVFRCSEKLKLYGWSVASNSRWSILNLCPSSMMHNYPNVYIGGVNAPPYPRFLRLWLIFIFYNNIKSNPIRKWTIIIIIYNHYLDYLFWIYTYLAFDIIIVMPLYVLIF